MAALNTLQICRAASLCQFLICALRISALLVRAQTHRKSSSYLVPKVFPLHKLIIPTWPSGCYPKQTEVCGRYIAVMGVGEKFLCRDPHSHLRSRLSESKFPFTTQCLYIFIFISYIADMTNSGASADANSRAELLKASGFPHFMLKEIFDQPEALRNTIAPRVSLSSGEIRIADEVRIGVQELRTLRRINVVASGTSR